MSKQPSYCPIRNYFKTHALELSDEKRTKIVDEWGYDTVESLKLMDEEEWSEIFDGSFNKDSAITPQTVELGNDDDDDETETEKVNVPGIDDADWYNFDHVPVWQEPVRTFSWGKKDSGRRNVRTAGREKNRYTVVLGITMTGEKCIPLIIFKGAPAKKGQKCGNSASITYEIKNNLPDKY
eukprot:scaffold45365_cov81-Cyclotella_meneghiniana.AAC.4